MKTLFAIVSCIAMTYLLAQTSFAKHLANSVYISFSSTSDTNEKETAPHTQALKLMLAQYESAQQNNQETISQLGLKVGELTQKVNTLHQQLDSIHANAEHAEVQSDMGNSLNEKTQESTNQIDDNNVSSQLNNNKNRSMDNKFSKNEQQKRLQQQAVLRQIAQKMELSAIKSLSAGS